MSSKIHRVLLATMAASAVATPIALAQVTLPDGTPDPAYDGLYAWYQADDGPGAGKFPAVDGSPVNNWLDSSDNGRDLVRVSADAGRIPLYATNAAGSGMPSVEFDGDDYIWANQVDEFGKITTGRTIFIVARMDVINNGHLFDSCTIAGRNAMFGGWSQSPENWAVYTGVDVIDCGPIVTEELVSISMTLENGAQSIVINDGEPITASLEIQNLSGFLLGNRYNVVNGMIGGIYEVLVYSESLPEEQISEIDLYLTIKYAPDDCNQNGIPDRDEIASGAAPDCNGNLIPDECDLADVVSLSEPRTPTSISDFIEFDVSNMPISAEAVTLDVSAVGDLAASSEFMFVYLDDEQVGLAFVSDGLACTPVTNTFSIPSAQWNAAGADGPRLVRISGVNIAPDVCQSPSTSIRVVVTPPIPDCDGNGIWDACDISAGDAADLDGNGVPDSCDPDCDGDGEPDGYEISSGQDLDCNGNLVPDACDLADGSSTDIDGNGVPDECKPDCNDNGLPDTYDIASGLEEDCNGNGRPDSCDIADLADPDCDADGIIDFCAIANGTAMDCNSNEVPDSCDIANGTSNDVDSNGTPDECKDDCNGNGLPDYWEILKGSVEDCDGNGIPDPCDIASGGLADCDLDGRWDECAIDDGSVTDCNGNRVPDSCDIDGKTDEDDNGNDIPDACEIALGDFNLDGCIDSGDLGLLIALWGIQDPPFGDLNGDGVIAAADLGLLIGNWTPCP